MTNINKEDLAKEIEVILKDADLEKTSVKNVRQQLEKKMECDLKSWAPVITQIVMDHVNKMESHNEDDDEILSEDDDDDDNNETKLADIQEKEIATILMGADLNKTSAKTVRLQLEKKLGRDLKSCAPIIGQIVINHVNRMEEGKKSESQAEPSNNESSCDSDEEMKDEAAKRVTRNRKSPPKKKGGKKGGGGGGGGGRGNGYTRPLRLSAALAALLGAPAMPRHEVVKRVWAIIKEKQLYDPTNRQFAICDDALYTVIGTKRFRTFGMMKYLKSHFLDD